MTDCTQHPCCTIRESLVTLGVTAESLLELICEDLQRGLIDAAKRRLAFVDEIVSREGCNQCFLSRRLPIIKAILGRPDDQIPVAQIRAVIEKQEPKPDPITLESGLRDLGISNRTATLLETRAGIYTLQTLLLWTPGLLLGLRDIGEASVAEIEAAIGRHGYRLSE